MRPVAPFGTKKKQPVILHHTKQQRHHLTTYPSGHLRAIVVAAEKKIIDCARSKIENRRTTQTLAVRVDATTRKQKQRQTLLVYASTQHMTKKETVTVRTPRNGRKTTRAYRKSRKSQHRQTDQLPSACACAGVSEVPLNTQKHVLSSGRFAQASADTLAKKRSNKEAII